MEGGEEGGSALCRGDRGKPPERSLCGVRTMLHMAACKDYAKKGKKQITEHTEKCFVPRLLKGICVDSFFLFLLLPLIHVQCSKCCVDPKIRR